ncbi:MAG: hypothetical protein V5A88_08980 [Candidatus Thermoplasmatota archaeon]
MPDTKGIRSTLSMKSGGMVLLVKLFAITILLLLSLWGRGVIAVVVIILIVPLWLIAEIVMFETSASPFWKSIGGREEKSIEESEEFPRLPLATDINKMKGAKKGQKVKQAILEGRLKDQVFYTLKNEYNLSEEEIKVLDEDPGSMAEKIDNEKLIEYLKNVRDLDDLKSPDDEDIDGKDLDFKDKMRSTVSELENIHYIKEDR